MEVTFKIIKKNGKPFMRMICGDYQKEMMIYGAKTSSPYVKYMSGFAGKTFLSEDMKDELRKMLAA